MASAYPRLDYKVKSRVKLMQAPDCYIWIQHLQNRRVSREKILEGGGGLPVYCGL